MKIGEVCLSRLVFTYIMVVILSAQIYDFHIFIFIYSSFTGILRTDPALSWLVSSVAGPLHQYH